MRVQDKVVVVTGGGDGIGRQVVLEVLARGGRVTAVDIRKERLDETAELADAGDRLDVVAVDVTDRLAVAELPRQVTAHHGSVDALIHVAGIIQPFERVETLAWEAIDRVVDVNLVGTLNVVRAFLPAMLERPEAHLVTVSSMAACVPVPGQAVYGATKAAVTSLTEGLYAELLDTQVDVSVVVCGAVTTDIAANSGVEVPAAAAAAREEPGRLPMPTTTPSEAARIICDGMEKNRLHIHVGKDAVAFSAMSRLAPRLATHLIQHQMRDLLD